MSELLVSVSRSLPTIQPVQPTEDPDLIALESTLTLCLDNLSKPLYGKLHPSSCNPTREVDIVLTVWYVVLLLAMVVLNGRIMYKLWANRGRKQRDLKNRIDNLVGVLCVSDVLMIIPILLTAFSMGYGRSKFSSEFYPPASSHSTPTFVSVWCSMSSFLFGFSSQLSVLVVMFISLLRLISVCFPVKAAVILSPRTVFACMSVSVLIVLCLAIQPYISLEVVYMANEGICAHRSSNTTSTPELFLTSTVPYIIPIIISVLCLAGIIFKMKQMKRVNLNNNKSEKQLYSIMMVAVQVISAFVVCFLPWIVDGFAFLVTQRGGKTLYGKGVCSSCGSIMYVRHVCKVFLVYFNCLINPFLYGKLIDIGVEKKRYGGNHSTSSTSTTRALFSASVISRVNLIRDKLV